MDMLQLLTSLNVIIGICYLLLSFLIVLLPFAIRSLRVMGIWGAIMAFHTILFLTGCGLHHFEFSGHIILTIAEFDAVARHFLITSIMQIYGALGVAAITVFRGKKMVHGVTRELVKASSKEEL